MRLTRAISRSLFSLAAVTLLVGCGSEQDGSAPSASISGGQENAETGSSKASMDHLRPVVLVETSLGKIEIQLDGVAAPGTVSNFLNYVSDQHFSDTTFHYVNPEKMILGGAYSSDGSEKPAGQPIRSEAFNGLKNVRGAVAMNRFPDSENSATCQFFINVRDNPNFDYRAPEVKPTEPGEESGAGSLPNVPPQDFGYCVFGQVIRGMDVVDKIANLATNSKPGRVGAPVEPAVIRSVRMKGGSAGSL